MCVCVCVCENINSLTNNIIGGETSNILWYFLRTCTWVNFQINKMNNYFSSKNEFV